MIDLTGEGASIAFGAKLGEAIQPGDVIALTGTLGAGKTTLARGILKGAGFEDEVASPTYPIMIGYEPPDTYIALAHCDFYRFDDPGEADELGLEDWLQDGAVLIEWPDKGPAVLLRNALAIHIEIVAPDTRRLTATPGPAWTERWAILQQG